MLLRWTARLVAAAIVVLGVGGIGVAGPASACACGGVAVPSGADARVADETALLSWDGQHETIDMRLGLRTTGDSAGLIVPTPTPATVTAGSTGTFSELSELTAPRVIKDREWFGHGGLGFGLTVGAGAPPRDGRPTVLAQVQLGPLQATTLSGGDLTGVRQWLSDNGYRMRDEVIATLQPYLSDGWSFVAMRLTSTAPLAGSLDPVRLSFASGRMVYPMRMSRAATQTQTVRLYVLGAHRMQRDDADSDWQDPTVTFAGRIDPADADLKQLSANGHDFLTAMTVTIRETAQISSDFRFADAPHDDAYREVEHRTVYVEFLGIPAGYAVMIGVVLLTVVVSVVMLRRSPSSRRR